MATKMQKGDKIEVKVTITDVTKRFIESKDGGTWNSPERTYKMQDDDGNTYKWFAKMGVIGLGMQGERITLRGTVKAVTEVDGKQWVEIIRGRRAK